MWFFEYICGFEGYLYLLKMAERSWFVIGMRYLRASKLEEKFKSRGYETFVPPVVTNLLFVHSDYLPLFKYLEEKSFGHPVYFLRKREDWQPMEIRDSEMQKFILVCKAYAQPIILTECPKLKLGDKVRIKDGELKGVEGHIVRLKKQKRVLINVDNAFWVATAHIEPELLELI